MPDKTLLDWALYWAECGVPVFPCHSDKSPMTTNGFYDATTDLKEVKRLFDFYGDQAAMIGGRTGEASGLLVIDVDLYKEGAQAWYKSAVDSGSLPETRVHSTKNGGLHLLYESEDFPTTVIGPGVDVKGEGGYVILPGSPGYSVKQEGLSKAPAGLIEQIRHKVQNNRLTGTSELEAQVLKAESFHEAMTVLAARKASGGMEFSDIVSYLNGLMENSVARNPTNDRHARWHKCITSDEIIRIAQSAHIKFNHDAAIDDLKNDIDESVWDDLITATMGLFTGLGEDAGHLIEPDYVPLDSDWPYEGYEAHEDVSIEDRTAVMWPLFFQGETTVMFAEAKSGKTAIMLSAALSISCGMDMGEWKVPEPVPSLYFALEGNQAIRLRVQAWKKYKAEEGVQLPETIPMYVAEHAPPFYQDKQQEMHVKLISAHNRVCLNKYEKPLGMIVIDTLTKAMTGGDQNSAEDTAQLFELVRLLRSSGITASIVFVHHKSRGSEKARGSTNIEAEPDVLLDVSKDGSLSTAKVARARSIEEGGKYGFKLTGVDLGENKQGYNMQGVVPIPASIRRASIYDEVIIRMLGAGSTSIGIKEVIGYMSECQIFGGKIPSPSSDAFKQHIDAMMQGQPAIEEGGMMISVNYDNKGTPVSVSVVKA